MRLTGKIFLLAFVMAFAATSAFACTPMGAGKDATVDGSTMVSHTCDGWYDNRIQVVEGKTFEDGAMAPVYQELGHATQPTRPAIKVMDIPQVKETYTYFHIGYPFMNEHQIMIAEDTWGGRDETMNAQGAFWIETLEIFGLQRGKTAREVVQVMGDLAEKYGYSDGGETLLVADPEEVWVFDVCGAGPLWQQGSDEAGAIWAARRIPDDQVVVCANRSRIGVLDFDDEDNFMYSPNVRSFAKNMGWWKEGEEFNFSTIYNPRPYGSDYYQSRREWRALTLLAPSKNFKPVSQAEHYPFSVKPDKKVTVQDLMAIYRDHLEGTEFDLTKGLAAGPFDNPNRWATPRSVKPEGKENLDWERCIAMFRCSYSFVAQSRSWLPDSIGGVLWFGQDAPDTTCYVPIYCGVTEIPRSWSEGQRHVFDRTHAWWAFNFVNNWANIKWSYMIKDINAAQEKYEGLFFANQPMIEEKAEKLYKEDPAKAVAFLTDYTNANMMAVENAWWTLGEYLVGKYQDGYVMTPEGKQESVGYPTEWLEKVGFGETMKQK